MESIAAKKPKGSKKGHIRGESRKTDVKMKGGERKGGGFFLEGKGAQKHVHVKSGLTDPPGTGLLSPFPSFSSV